MANQEYQAAPDQSPNDKTPEGGEVVPEFEKGLSDVEITQLIVPIVQDADTTYQDRKEIYSRLERLYFGKIAEGSPVEELPVQYSSGMAFQLHETVMPLLTSGKFRPSLQGVEEGDDDSATLNEQLLCHQIEQDDLEKPIEDYIMQAGKTIGAIRVDKKIEKMKTFRKKRSFEMTLPFTDKKFAFGPMKEVEEETERFYHILETIPYEDLIIPEGRTTDSLPFIGMKFGKKIKDMETDKRFHNIKELKLSIANGWVTRKEIDVDQYTIDRADAKGINMDALNPLLIEQEIQLIDVYFTYKNCIYLATLDQSSLTCVRSEKVNNWHQMYPIRLLSIYTTENSAIGQSILEVVEKDIDEYDIWLNIIFSVGLIDVQKPVIYDKDKVSIEFQKNPIKYGPGVLYPTTDVNAFKIAETPRVEPSHLEILSAIVRRIQDKTGINDYIAGTGTLNEDKTLGEVELKTAQSKKRFSKPLKNVRRAVGEIFFMMLSNNQQYLPDNYEIRILGRRGSKMKRFSAESIQGRFDVSVKGFEDITIDEAQTVNKYRAMISDGVKLNQLAQMPLVNIPHLAKGLYEDGYKVRDIEKVVIPVQDNVNDQDQGKQQQALRAASENEDPLKSIVRPDDDHAIHLQIHELFMKSPAFEKVPQPTKTALARHIMAHRQMMQDAGAGAPGGPKAPGAESPLGIGNMAPADDLVARSEQ